MKNFSARIEYAVKLMGGPGAAVDKTGLSRGAIDKYRKGQSEPTRDRLVAIAKAAQIDVGWLATGNGDPAPGSDELVEIPRYDVRLAAGDGQFVSDERVIERVPVLLSHINNLGIKDTTNIICVGVQGDSMEGTVDEGDLVFIDTSDTAIVGGVFGIVMDDRALVKRVHKTVKGVVEVISDNKRYEKVELIGDEQNMLQIIGRVRGKMCFM